jgi:hypothetical protein
MPGAWTYCFRCQHRGSYDQLAEQFEIRKAHLSSVIHHQPQQGAPNHSPSPVAPEQWSDFDHDSVYCRGALSYLHRRKLDDSIIARMVIKYGFGKLFGRVVFVDEVNKYYVARAFLPGIAPKTFNPDVSSRPVMYLHKKQYQTLYLVEGTFDAVPFFKTGRDAACLLGKNISPVQIEQLRKVEVASLVVALDADAMRESYELARRLAGVFPFSNVGVLVYNNKRCKDPGEYDVDLFTGATVVDFVRVMNPSLLQNV